MTHEPAVPGAAPRLGAAMMRGALRRTPSTAGGAAPLAVVGCDFRVASTHWRSALVLDDPARDALIDALRGSGHADGLAVLETCNRVEWIAACDDPGWTVQLLRAQMLERWRGAAAPGQLPQPYVYTGDNAVRHLVRVAVGLESFVVGEREIAGQLNRALTGARQQGHHAPALNGLQTTLGRAVKRVHRLTRLGATTRGVHGLAMDLLDAQLRPGRARVAVLGMGEIGRKVANLLASRRDRFEVWRVNRTVPERQRDVWQPLASLPTLLADADALVIATGAREPVVRGETLRRLARQTPLVMVDLGAPRQVDAVVASRPDVQLFGLDDLLAGDQRVAAEDDLQTARALVHDAVAEFRVSLRKRELADLLRVAQDGYDRFVADELPALVDEALPPADDPEVRRARAALEDGLRAAMRRQVRELIETLEGWSARSPRGS